MTPTRSILTVFHSPDLYEITISGTLIYGIQKFVDGSNCGRKVGFENLPNPVKEKIVTHIKKVKRMKGFIPIAMIMFLASFGFVGSVAYLLQLLRYL